MKNSILVSLFFFASIFCFAQTQSEMNQNANQDFIKADKELNQVYKRILNDYKADTLFLSKLKIAQNLWIKFRDAEMNALFPEEETQTNYGSVFPMCWSMHMANLTNERIKTLKRWVNGVEEGDVCSGSVKIK